MEAADAITATERDELLLAWVIPVEPACTACINYCCASREQDLFARRTGHHPACPSLPPYGRRTVAT